MLSEEFLVVREKTMKPKLTDEEKKKLLREVISKLEICQDLLDDAYKHHCIAAGIAANDEAGSGHSGPA